MCPLIAFKNQASSRDKHRIRGVKKKMSKNFVKGRGLCVALIIVTLLFNAKCSKATSVEINSSSSSSFFQCSHGSSINDCLDEGLDFVMGSEANNPGLDLGKALDPNHPVVDCGKGKSTKSCLPNPNDPRVAEHCYSNGVYTQNRGC